MAVYGQPYKEAKFITSDRLTKGAPLGFLENLQNSFYLNTLYQAQFGVEYALFEEDQANLQRLLATGEKTIPGPLAYEYRILESGHYKDVAKAIIEEDQTRLDSLLQGRDENLQKLKVKYPEAGIQTYSEMFGNVKKRSDELRQLNERNATAGGYIGSFIGGMIGGVDPRTNPLGFVTLPLGGFGKNVVIRVATEALGQSAAEAVAQVTGLRENQRMLGGDPTIGDALFDIGVAGVGGAAFQGVAEGVAEGVGAAFRAGRRHWFPDAPANTGPDIPANARPAIAPVTFREFTPAETTARDLRIGQAVRNTIRGSRADRAGFIDDFEHAAKELNRFDGPRSFEVMPKGFDPLIRDTILIDGSGVNRSSVMRTDEILARNVDPKSFKIHDKLNNQLQTQKEMLIALGGAKEIDNQKRMFDLEDKIDNLQNKLDIARPQNKGMIQAALDKAVNDRIALHAEINKGDTPEIINQRKNLINTDDEIRNIQPAIDRAYNRAKGEWGGYTKQRDRGSPQESASLDIFESASQKLNETKPATLTPRTVQDIVPELRKTTTSSGKELPADDPIKAVQMVREEDVKIKDDVLEKWRNAIGRLLTAEKETGEKIVRLEGVKHEFLLDESVTIPDEITGEPNTFTLREHLEELEDDNVMMAALSVCNIAGAK
jgi:hypothetical protein